MDIEGNNHLSREVWLLDKEVAQAESISHTICWYIGDSTEEQEKELEDLYHKLLSKNLKALSFIVHGLDLPSN